MKYKIEGNCLVMTVDETERAKLQADKDEAPDHFGTEGYMGDLLENMIANDCFEWLQSFATGDLTNAPMLGIYGEEEKHDKAPEVGSGLLVVGFNEGKHDCVSITHRWAFMGYQVTTPQEDLLRTGRAVWEGGELLKREGQELTTTGGEVTLKFDN